MLDNALDYGITEERFWNMTLAEIKRAIESAIRVKKIETQERATYDYILAHLITKGVMKSMGDKSNYPTIEEAYPGIFNDITVEKQAKINEQKNNLSAIRFKQFTQSYNKRFKNREVAKEINE